MDLLYLISQKIIMNIHSFKKLAIILIAPFFLLSFISMPARTNFGGQWKLNEGKSELGEFTGFAAKSVKIEQKEDAITITQVNSFNGEEMTRTETLTFDGKETESSGGFGNAKRKSTAKWSDDGKMLTLSYVLKLEFNGETNEIKGTEKYSLSDDGKTLTLQSNTATPQGDISSKAVYDKQ
jgi:hypothetical protein